jgi:hypothetical protein
VYDDAARRVYDIPKIKEVDYLAEQSSKESLTFLSSRLKSASMTVRPKKKTDTKVPNSLEQSLNYNSTEKLESKKISLENYINHAETVNSPTCKP